uniref:Fidgetin-like protein 1 n=1 Tax=Strigamia maritima TaxID=126957 RepID=T1JG46_STRMM
MFSGNAASMEEIENQLLHHWQASKFKAATSNYSLHSKADDLRTRLAHLSFAETLQAQSNINDSIIKTSIKDLLNEYSLIVDVEDGGLNNYADQILKTTEGKKLENDKWTSGLTIENVCELDVMQDFIKKKPKPKDNNVKKTFLEKRLEQIQLLEKIHQLNETCPRKKAGCDEDDLFTDSSCADQHVSNAFCTAKEQLIIENANKKSNQNVSAQSYGVLKKSLGSRRNLGNKFISPVLTKEIDDADRESASFSSQLLQPEGHLKNIEPRMIEMIENEIMDHGSPVSWDDIAGLEFAKAEIKEVIIWPMLRPDLFTGLRSVPKGILLFGPPGTGKTMIGKCIASQSKAVFFSISASSLTSKWVGEGEKMVKCLFAVARSRQPAVIFIDEIDSLLTHRSDTEHESSRRIKTEFLIQLDGAATSLDERVLVIGATNRPQELDEAARRRLVKRLFIPLPDLSARKQIILRLLSKHLHSINDEQALDISVKTEGYSGADMANLCRAAALGPIRSIDFSMIQKIQPNEVRPINYEDFVDALRRVKTSVSDQNMKEYVEWNYKYGSEA